jgi:Mu-like prophage I protein
VQGTLDKVPDLISLKAISNGALKGGSLPTRLKLLNWGTNDTVQGPVIVDDSCVEVFSANQRSLGFERVALDFEHNTVPGSPEYERTKEPRDIAAQGAPRIVRGDGLYLEDLTWFNVGKDKAPTYEDLSPAVKWDDSKRLIFMHSTALTRNGAVYGLTFLSAKIMSNQNQQLADAGKFITLAALAGAIGLAATATEADVVAQLKHLSAVGNMLEMKDGKIILLPLAELGGRLTKIEEAATKGIAALSATVDGKVITFTAEDVVKLSAKITTLETSLNTDAKNREDLLKGELLGRFSAEGKAPNGEDGKPMTADTLRTLSAPTLKMLLANTPVTVPLNARGRINGDRPARDPNLKGAARMAAAFEEDNRSMRN